jgi:hypothetical protein
MPHSRSMSWAKRGGPERGGDPTRFDARLYWPDRRERIETGDAIGDDDPAVSPGLTAGSGLTHRFLKLLLSRVLVAAALVPVLRRAVRSPLTKIMDARKHSRAPATGVTEFEESVAIALRASVGSTDAAGNQLRGSVRSCMIVTMKSRALTAPSCFGVLGPTRATRLAVRSLGRRPQQRRNSVRRFSGALSAEKGALGDERHRSLFRDRCATVGGSEQHLASDGQRRPNPLLHGRRRPIGQLG